MTFQGLRRLTPALVAEDVLIRLAPGTDLGRIGFGPGFQSYQGVPALVAPGTALFTGLEELRDTRAMPLILGGVLAVAAMLALAHMLVSSIRHRRRDLAILRSLGFVGGQVRAAVAWQAGTLDFKRTKEAVFLTAKTTAMVCWLFVGSALFSGVFAILGGQALVEQWVLSLNMTPIQFMILSQAIIFVLGWPLEWTEIIIIFVPIFLPMLKHFNIDPILWGTLVFVNLQAAFLSPPVAMSAFYLKGVAPKHVTLNQIFAGMMPYMLIVILCMVIMYLWPGMTLWLPNYLYGG